MRLPLPSQRTNAFRRVSDPPQSWAVEPITTGLSPSRYSVPARCAKCYLTFRPSPLTSPLFQYRSNRLGKWNRWCHLLADYELPSAGLGLWESNIPFSLYSPFSYYVGPLSFVIVVQSSPRVSLIVVALSLLVFQLIYWPLSLWSSCLAFRSSPFSIVLLHAVTRAWLTSAATRIDSGYGRRSLLSSKI